MLPRSRYALAVAALIVVPSLQLITSAVLLWLTAQALALATWPVRRLRPAWRIAVLVPVAGLIASLTFWYPREPVGLKAFVTLFCMVPFVKLLDLHVGADDWRTRTPGAWLRFVVNPWVLVYRRHIEEPPRPRREAVPILARGITEIVAGAALLVLAFHLDLGRWSFWLEHTVKLLCAYLLVFDGGYVTITATLRLIGCNVLDQSREPILAVSPADFWRRYNRDAGRFLYEDIFLPVGGAHAPRRAILVAFAANGLLHEYLAWAIIGRVLGYQIAFFLVQGAAVALTFRLRPRGPGALAGWAATMVFMDVSAVLFLATVQEIIPWYSAR